MKRMKLFLMVLATVSTVAIFSCGSKTEQPATDQATTEQAPVQEQAPAADTTAPAPAN